MFSPEQKIHVRQRLLICNSLELTCLRQISKTISKQKTPRNPELIFFLKTCLQSFSSGSRVQDCLVEIEGHNTKTKLLGNHSMKIFHAMIADFDWVLLYPLMS